jgi:hypothetical protein
LYFIEIWPQQTTILTTDKQLVNERYSDPELELKRKQCMELKGRPAMI